MLPMVVAGGLMIALSFVFGITAFKEEGTLAAALMQIGGDDRVQTHGAAAGRLHRLFDCRPSGPGAGDDRRLAGQHPGRRFYRRDHCRFPRRLRGAGDQSLCAVAAES